MNLLARQFKGLVEAGLPFILVQILFLSYIFISFGEAAHPFEIYSGLAYVTMVTGIVLSLVFVLKREEYLYSAMLHIYATGFAIIAAGRMLEGGMSVYFALIAIFFMLFVSLSATDHNKLMRSRLWDLTTPISVGTALYMKLSQWEFFTFNSSGYFNLFGLFEKGLRYDLIGSEFDIALMALVLFVPTAISTAVASVELEAKTAAPKRNIGPSMAS